MRSILFVPATRLDLVEKAAKGDATAICLDLEDGVARSEKPAARANVARALEILSVSDKRSLLRINSTLEDISFDLETVAGALDYIVLPMTGGRQHLTLLSDWADRKFDRAGPRIVAMVETADGVAGLTQENRPLPWRLSHVALGSEDFAASQGCTPDAAPIAAAFVSLAHFCAQWGLELLGYPGSIAEFRDLEAFEQSVTRGRVSGAVGGFCIHPKQVAVLNAAFGVSQAEQARAQKIVTTFEAALSQGQGAIQLDGKMIDRPIYLAAQRVLERV